MILSYLLTQDMYPTISTTSLWDTLSVGTILLDRALIE